jgi:hypothetical protein
LGAFSYLGAHGDGDGVGQLVDADKHGGACFGSEANVLR